MQTAGTLYRMITTTKDDLEVLRDAVRRLRALARESDDLGGKLLALADETEATANEMERGFIRERVTRPKIV